MILKYAGKQREHHKDYTLCIIFGEGFKTDNAEMLVSIPEIDDNFVAFTRFQRVEFYSDEYLEIIRTYLGR